jgi:hypothetical protein
MVWFRDAGWSRNPIKMIPIRDRGVKRAGNPSQNKKNERKLLKCKIIRPCPKLTHSNLDQVKNKTINI